MSGRPPAGRVARPAARYRPGKAPAAGPGGLNSDDDSDEEDEQQGQVQDQVLTSLDSRGVSRAHPQQRRTAGVVIQSGTSKINLDLTSVQVGKKEKEPESSEYETDTDESDAAPPPKPVFRKPGTQAAAPAPAAKESSSEYETDSDEEEEEAKPMLKPVFVPKRARGTIAERDAAAIAALDADAKAQAEAEARRKEAHLLAAESIKRSLAEKEHENAKPDLDDTDGKDPAAEFAAWRIRELSRIKRDREAAAALELEKEEVLRRREMPEAVRDREDTERAKKQREEAKAQRGKQGFLQKYYHKGAFFQDMDILKKRDYQQATESAIDKTNLPAIMQVRDFGKRSRSKYTHLAAEDTTRQEPKGPGSLSAQQGCFRCGGPHLARDCTEADTRFQRDGRQASERTSERSKDSGWSSRARDSDLHSRRRDDDRDDSRRDTQSRPREHSGTGDLRRREHRDDRDRDRRTGEDRKERERERSAPKKEGREWKGMYGGYGRTEGRDR